MIKSALEHLRSGDLTVGVVGLGYVGLPLSVEIAKAGIRAVGFDIDSAVVDGINGGTSHIEDVTDQELAEVTNRCIPAECGFFSRDAMAVEIVAELACSSLKLGIVSNTVKPGATIDDFLEREGVLSYFPVRI